MASIWKIFTEGYAQYEWEKKFEGIKKLNLDLTFREDLRKVSDYELREAYGWAKDLGDSKRKKLLYDEMIRRGFKPL